MASRSLNHVTLIGNLTRDPELKYTPSGTAVCSFGLATNRSWTTADGQTKEDTQFHRIVAWQKLAELCAKLLSKGKKVYLEGRITYRSFMGKDGTQKNITEIVMEDFIVFFDGKRSTDVSAAEDSASNTDDTEKDTHNTEEDADIPQQEEVDMDDIPF